METTSIPPNLVTRSRSIPRERTHEASGVSVVGADLVVHLNQSLSGDRGDLTSSQGILEAVTEEDGEREGLAELVGTGGRAGGLQYNSINLKAVN